MNGLRPRPQQPGLWALARHGSDQRDVRPIDLLAFGGFLTGFLDRLFACLRQHLLVALRQLIFLPHFVSPPGLWRTRWTVGAPHAAEYLICDPHAERPTDRHEEAPEKPDQDDVNGNLRNDRH
jgi:hypothetical protein